ncbi:MAG: rRNA pseudouridine synthase [Erysipelotrichaceae bacterium]|nr:rRNA pseudouridine synthase [Erysipelotrichaceae bacterium]
MITMRLDKLLSSSGLGTRKEVKELIRKKHVIVNNKIITNDDFKVDENTDIIFVDGEEIKYQKYIYIMLNKPAGVVSATFDSKEKTVIDLVSEYSHYDLFPFGRLDKDTEGLLILSNDGKLAHNLLSNKKHVTKKYYVEVLGKLNENDINIFKEGITIDGNEKCLPAVLEIIESNEKSRCFVTITEGKYHQVKRMFETLKKPVIYLKRVEFGSIHLDSSLSLGQYRLLKEEELNILLNKKK